MRDHELRPRPATLAFAALSMDDRWAAPSVEHLVERSIAIWQESFVMVVDDLLALPRSRPVVAEGPGAFPWCVAPLVMSRRQAIFLVPTPQWRVTAATRRWGRAQEARFPGIVDRERALAKVSARDDALDARIVSSCEELDLRCERVDGSRDIDASLELLEQQFRPHLPTKPNV